MDGERCDDSIVYVCVCAFDCLGGFFFFWNFGYSLLIMFLFIFGLVRNCLVWPGSRWGIFILLCFVISPVDTSVAVCTPFSSSLMLMEES